MTTLTVKAKQDFLQRVGTTRDPIKAVAEFVWNALDADASNVEVVLLRNELDGLQAIRVADDGTGITRERAVHDFESAGESWKRRKRHTAQKSRALHGKEGLGRLRFYSLANKARWNTTYAEGKERFKLDITLDAANLQSADVSEPVPAAPDAETGTAVELAPLKETFDWLSSDQARAEFGAPSGDDGSNDEIVTYRVGGLLPVIVWDAETRARRAVKMRWGFPDPRDWRRPRPIHARSETIDGKEPFRTPFHAGQRGIC